MTKQTIKVEGLPKGWKGIDYRCPFAYDYYFRFGKIERASSALYTRKEKMLNKILC